MVCRQCIIGAIMSVMWKKIVAFVINVPVICDDYGFYTFLVTG